MEIKKQAVAGTYESSDVYVVVSAHNSLEVKLESAVMAQYGESIVASAKEVAHQMNIDKALIEITDKGAVDCVIRARVETALKRAMEA